MRIHASEVRPVFSCTVAHAALSSLNCAVHRGPRAGRPGDRGATAAEYALMVSLIAVVVMGAVLIFGEKVSALFSIPPGYL